jgi:hypothetical protein
MGIGKRKPDEKRMMKIRIHHFFDIIRDFGTGKEILPHPNLHSYHIVAKEILENPAAQLDLVTGADAVCKNCIHLKNGRCTDFITHRPDFSGKEDFNNYLDQRVIEICRIDTSKNYTPETLFQFAQNYLENIETIYEGNEMWHTQRRKENVVSGLNFYSEKHNLKFLFG